MEYRFVNVIFQRAMHGAKSVKIDVHNDVRLDDLITQRTVIEIEGLACVDDPEDTNLLRDIADDGLNEIDGD